MQFNFQFGAHMILSTLYGVAACVGLEVSCGAHLTMEGPHHDFSYNTIFSSNQTSNVAMNLMEKLTRRALSQLIRLSDRRDSCQACRLRP